MATRLVVASQKGGVGKTTVALNLALAMAERGVQTLLVDLDPQGGIGHALARDDAALPGVADLLMNACLPAAAILRTRQPALSLLPRGRLSPVDAPEFERALNTPGVLESLLVSLETGSHLVVVDTPAGVGMVTRAALAVADWVLVPFQAESLAVRSMSQLMQVLEHVKQRENPRLKLLGAVPTMVDRAHAAGSAVLMDIWRDFPGVLETVIPRAEVFAVASNKGLPIAYLGGPPSPEAQRFALLAQEVDAIMTRHAGKEAPHVQAADRAFF